MGILWVLAALVVVGVAGFFAALLRAADAIDHDEEDTDG